MQAKAIGIPSVELVKLAQRGRLTRLGYGVYKLAQYSPASDGRDAYADSLALVDKDAYLYGQSVLALHNLCPTNPARIYVATPRRIRKKLDKGIQVIDSTPCEELEWYEGLPSQSISLAIRTARGTVMDERLREAINKFNLSPRAYNRILKVARTISDLSGLEQINDAAVMEAVSYRKSNFLSNE